MQHKKKQAGRFVLATNQLEKLALNPETMLSTYKNEQQKVEPCLKFVKDPMFFADSVFMALWLFGTWFAKLLLILKS